MKKLIALLLAAVLVFAPATVAFAADAEETAAANFLHTLGLFIGTGTDAEGSPVYELDRAPNRMEAVTMLVRLLGKEEEANAGTWEIPFTDVKDWAKPYVGYAYANGLTKGYSEKTFGGTDPVTAAQYLTFVLRALGYSSDSDFKWDAAWELSDKLDITSGEYDASTAAFDRGDVVKISFSALSAYLKGEGRVLGEKLLDEGVFTIEQYKAAMSGEAGGEEGQNPVMNWIGNYQYGRVTALVECEGTDSARIRIRWGASAWEEAVWVIVGKLDPETLTIRYTDAIETIVTWNDDGDIVSKETVYTDGTGTIVFNRDGTFTWHEDQSPYGEDMVFEWIPASGIDYLALVNKVNPLPDGWEDALETVTITNSVGESVEVEAKAYAAYERLKDDLEQNDGVYLELDSARRSVAAQQDIMDRFIEKYGADYATKTVAQPGYSEHHTGLALDLYFKIRNEDGSFTDVYYNEDMEKEEYKPIWDAIHAKLPKYGFILRYLEGEEHITGYRYEPWHIRYVDSEVIAGEIMSQPGYTLEEYLAGKSAPEAEIDLSGSALYTEEELTDAMLAIKCRFAAWGVCELHAIRYAGDEANSAENLEWLNTLNEGADYAQIAEFLMDFHTAPDAGGAWEQDLEYTDWQWWLARTEDGDWEIVTNGY